MAATWELGGPQFEVESKVKWNLSNTQQIMVLANVYELWVQSICQSFWQIFGTFLHSRG